MTQPGVYRSDLSGHLFVLKTDPFSITCIACMESCVPSKSIEPRKEAEIFTSNHGFLGERIADNITQVIP